jgi:hypothetical protein
MLIATTIVPWLALWLFYYEIWRITGKWLGKGAHAWENDDYRAEEIDPRPCRVSRF